MRKLSVSFVDKMFVILFVLFIAVCCLVSWNEPDGIAGSGVGVRTYAVQDVADTVTASTTPVATELTTPIAAGQKLHIRYYVPITLGGTAPGIKFLVNAPSGVVTYQSGVTIFADDDSVALVSQISSEAAQGVTLAKAGNHIAIIDATVFNGSTAGSVALEFAQNVSDNAATIVQKGAFAEIVKF